MARGRFISKSISESEQFAELPDHETRLMFLMMIPHADREGRVKADPRYLAGQVFTYLGFTPEQIIAALEALHEAELVRLYSVEGRAYLHFPKFETHQVGLRKDKEAESKIPPPTKQDTSGTALSVLRTNAGLTPDQGRSNDGARLGKEEVKDKAKDSSPPTPPHSSSAIEATKEEGLDSCGTSAPSSRATSRPAINRKPHLSSEERTARRLALGQSRSGAAILKHLGGHRVELEELERLASLWSETEILAAHQQAKRDAVHSTNKTFLLILQGEIALDKSLLPHKQPHAAAPPSDGLEPGMCVQLPDMSEHVIADVLRKPVGTLVVFEDDHPPVPPEACRPVPSGLSPSHGGVQRARAVN
jgi:hypothetical protein